jgi:hypothetical protein
MRAICESCAQPQPRDWRPGDLCVHCGQAVRREVRCYWCAKWTPVAKYCRKCGADVVDDPAMFAPARMLKDAGTDRFTIPKLLREFDADRLETFRAIYQSQAAIAMAHVADLAYIETFLYQNVWSPELEDRLVSQLPWPDGEGLTHEYRDGEGRLRHILETTPIDVTRDLAKLALLRSEDEWKRHRDAAGLLYHRDPRIREEAALALTHWRVLVSLGLPREFELEVDRILANSRLEEPVQVRQAYLFPQKYEVSPTLLGSLDPDVRFAAALAACAPDALRSAAISDDAGELTRYAAFSRLATADALDARSARSLGALEEEHLLSVLGTLARRKRAYPEFTSPFLEWMPKIESDRARERAAALLSRDLSYETALTIFEMDHDLAPVLFRSNMPPDAFERIANRLLDTGGFRASMYGLDAAAQAGRMPDLFVIPAFERTGNEELIRFAERQLETREIEPLMDFLVRCCFEAQGSACESAWSATSRLRHRTDVAAVTPFVFESGAVKRIFGSMQRFLSALVPFLRRAEWRNNVLIFDPLSRFIRYTDNDVFASVCGCDSSDEYVSALLELIDDPNGRGALRTNCFHPLIGVAVACPLLRQRIETAFRELASGPEFAYWAQYSIDRIATLTGLPADTQ